MATKLYLRYSDDYPLSGYRYLHTSAGAAVRTATVKTVSTGTNIQWTNVGNGGFVLSWVSGRSPSGGWTLAGAISFNIWARESLTSANCKIRARVYLRDTGGTETEIGGSPFDDNVEMGDTISALTWAPTPTSTAFAEDERLVVKFFITNVGTMAANNTCELNHNGGTGSADGDSWIQLTETVAFKAEDGTVAKELAATVDDGTRIPISALAPFSPAGIPGATGRTVELLVRGGGSFGGVPHPWPVDEAPASYLPWIGHTRAYFAGCHFADAANYATSFELTGSFPDFTNEYKVHTFIDAYTPNHSLIDLSSNYQSPGTLFLSVDSDIISGDPIVYEVNGHWNIEFRLQIVEINDSVGGLYYTGFFNSFLMSGNVAVKFQYTTVEGSFPTATTTHHTVVGGDSYSWTIPADDPADAFGLTGIVVGLYFDDLMPGYTLYNRLQMSLDEFRCLRENIDIQDGWSNLTGGPHEAQLSFIGPTVFDEPIMDVDEDWVQGLGGFGRSDPDDYPVAGGNDDRPRAAIESSPSWAMNLSTKGYAYETGDQEDLPVEWKITGDYVDVGDVTRTFTPFVATTVGEPDAISYPETDYLQWFHAYVTDGIYYLVHYPFWPSTASPVTDAIAGFSGGGGSTNESETIYEPFSLYAPDITSDFATHPIKHTNIGWIQGHNPLNDSPVHPINFTHSLLMDPDWANDNREYIHSYHHPPNPIKVLMGNRWRQGRLQFASSHLFTVMTSASFWVEGENCIISTVGDGVQFIATSVNATARTIEDDGDVLYAFKPYGFRYLRLRIKANIPDVQVSLLAGTFFSAGVPVWGGLRWDVQITDADTYYTFVLDLSRPDFYGNYVGGSGSWTTTNSAYHGDGFFYNGGQPIWLMFGNAGTFTVDYLEGYVDSSGDRIPLLLFHPLDGKGEGAAVSGSLEAYELIPAPTWAEGGERNMSLAVNGYRTFSIVPDDELSTLSFDELWDLLFDRLDTTANDTGIIVTVGTDTRKELFWLFNSELTEAHAGDGFGKPLIPDIEESRYAQRTGSFPHGVYGMGAAWANASFDRINYFRAEWIFGGEAIGIVPNYPSGVFLEIRDNPTATVLDTSPLNDDGMFRLFTRYGTRLPRDNVDKSAEYTLVLVPDPAGPPPSFSITYTTLGNALNSYWIWADFPGGTDGDGYISTPGWTPYVQQNNRRDIPILDRYQTWLSIPVFNETFIGTDICASLSALHRVYYCAGNVCHGINVDRGKLTSWVDTVIPIGATATDTAPTITCDDHNNLWVAFHGESGGDDLAQLFRSDDLGDTWVFVDEVAGNKFPRVTTTLESVWVAMHDGSQINIYELRDSLLVLWESIPDASDPQLAAYSSDYRNRHILLYSADGVLKQIENKGRVLGTAETITGSAGRTKPVAVYPVFGYPYGRHFFWDGANLVVAQTISTFIGEIAVDGSVPTSEVEQVVGACIDRFGHWWVTVQKVDGTIDLYKSEDGGSTFFLMM